MKDAEEKVRAMCRAFSHEIKDTPALPSERTRDFRVLLLEEEFDEYLDAEQSNDIIKIADALADMCVIILGTAAAYGIPLAEVFDEVHRSNMAKVGPDGTFMRREDGKVLKPEGWMPPNIKAILKTKEG